MSASDVSFGANKVAHVGKRAQLHHFRDREQPGQGRDYGLFFIPSI